jgi:hypothetical protein
MCLISTHASGSASSGPESAAIATFLYQKLRYVYLHNTSYKYFGCLANHGFELFDFNGLLIKFTWRSMIALVVDEFCHLVLAVSSS